MIASLSELPADSRTRAEHWLDSVVSSLAQPMRQWMRDDLKAELCDRLTARSTPADVDLAIVEIGELDLSGATEQTEDSEDGNDASTSGSWGETISRSWWDPRSPKILVPRVAGVGWDLNFGALAVRLGLIEPDAEDVPFERTPEAALKAASMPPLLLGSAVIAHYLVRGSDLPERLPNHWNFKGEPDQWVSKDTAMALDCLAATAGAVLAVGGQKSWRSSPARAGLLSMAAGVATAAAEVTVLRDAGTKTRWWSGPAAAAGVLAAAGGTLYALAITGRWSEQHLDLADG